MLRGGLAAAVPESPYLYPEDDLTDLPDRLLAAELVREQIFLQTHEEVPYACTVETESFKEMKDGAVRIEAKLSLAVPRPTTGESPQRTTVRLAKRAKSSVEVGLGSRTT